MSPEEVGTCSFWQFGAAVSGWNATHGSGDQAGLTQQDGDDLWQGVMDRMN
ncbi:hypothetical protein [Pseudogemmobacter faecipullorum]|uniref:Uncharacterized protein n=1 Tax=Pseudogemmobacter faecipullorum TaxID=2755041 RepID=A0ABS8CPJ6_9RHOB|nr:hypothetical protein [Pseudogemmobacter faecipullorum]MCB5411319.1 hypothetical protein [Pseudogemmobacter faecipullorum]